MTTAAFLAPQSEKSPKILGEGTYGKVYAAVDSAGRNVAIKEMRLPQKGVIKPLELAISAHVISPYLVNCSEIKYEADSNGDHIVRMFLPLGFNNLRKWIEAAKPNRSSRWEICRRILLGIYALHSINIVHGDIKTDNVIMLPSENGSDLPLVKLGDFGLSFFEGTAIAKMDYYTPTYRPPECWSKDGECCMESDIWAWGCVVFEVCYGGFAVPLQRGEGRVNLLRYKRASRDLMRLLGYPDNTMPRDFQEPLDFDSEYIPPKLPPSFKLADGPASIIKMCLNPVPTERHTAQKILCYTYQCAVDGAQVSAPEMGELTEVQLLEIASISTSPTMKRLIEKMLRIYAKKGPVIAENVLLAHRIASKILLPRTEKSDFWSGYAALEIEFFCKINHYLLLL